MTEDIAELYLRFMFIIDMAISVDIETVGLLVLKEYVTGLNIDDKVRGLLNQIDKRIEYNHSL